MKVNTRKAIFEFSSIVIAVVLAMGLTEWRQSYLNHKMAEASFEKIVQEVRENVAELKTDSLKMANDLKAMTEWVRQWTLKEKKVPLGANFSYSFLSKSALEVARINQSLTFLPGDKVLAIAEIYATQDFYSENAAEIFHLMGDLQGEINRSESQEFFASVQKLRFHMRLVFNTVKAYLNESEDFLEKYGTGINSEQTTDE
ncbi:MAG: hypothetical protein HEP71_22870 [Roseivirga sp.]|nr:hypothetical protein [Roseivirga sp.]